MVDLTNLLSISRADPKNLKLMLDCCFCKRKKEEKGLEQIDIVETTSIEEMKRVVLTSF